MLHKLWVGEGVGLERFGDIRGKGVILEETMKDLVEMKNSEMMIMKVRNCPRRVGTKMSSFYKSSPKMSSYIFVQYKNVQYKNVQFFSNKVALFSTS